MTEEQPQKTVEMREIAPEVVEYLCAACTETTFIKDFLEQKLAKLDITYERLPDSVPDEDNILWAVLCQGSNNQFGRHLAQIKVTRHAVRAPIEIPPLQGVKTA